jgi:hypothetical protein
MRAGTCIRRCIHLVWAPKLALTCKYASAAYTACTFRGSTPGVAPGKRIGAVWTTSA